MSTPTPPLHVSLLRIYIDAQAVRDGEPYWKVLIERARSMGIANAAVMKLVDGYGPAPSVHGGKAIDLANGGHLIVEMSDSAAALESLRATLDVSDDIGLVTLESVAVVGFGGHRH